MKPTKFYLTLNSGSSMNGTLTKNNKMIRNRKLIKNMVSIVDPMENLGKVILLTNTLKIFNNGFADKRDKSIKDLRKLRKRGIFKITQTGSRQTLSKKIS